MSVPPTEAELDAVHETIMSPQCRSSYINKLPVRVARSLCRRLRLPFGSSGARGSIREDYIAALKQYVRTRLIQSHVAHVSPQRQDMYAHMEQSSAKRKASELGEEEASDETEAKRKKDSHSNMAVTSECVPSIIGMRPNVEATTPLKRPASPTDEESLGDPRIIKRMRLQSGQTIKLVRFKLQNDNRTPAPSATHRAEKTAGDVVRGSTKHVRLLPREEELANPLTSQPAHTATTDVLPGYSHTAMPPPVCEPSGAQPRVRGSRRDCVHEDASDAVSVLYFSFESVDLILVEGLVVYYTIVCESGRVGSHRRNDIPAVIERRCRFIGDSPIAQG